MFWKYNSPSSVQIDALLQQENVSLHELMDEEELLQECKAQNKKLVDYLTQPEILKELVTLVVTDPSPDKELQVQFKYANLASELLTCDVTAIIDKIATSSNLLQMLYWFLEKEKPLNPLLASFVSKVFGMLVQRRSEQVLDFLKSQGDFVEVTVKHIGTSAVMDLLAKLLCGVDDDDQDIKRGIHQWLNECHLIEQLIDKLSPDCDSEEHSSVDQLLSEIVATGQDSSNNGSDLQMNCSQSRLLTTLESKEMIDKLMDILLHEDRNESSVSHVINILLTLLSFKGSHKQSKKGNNCEVDSRTTVLRTILARLPNLHKILMQPTKLGNLTTAYGMEIERLGSTRLKVVSLISALIATQEICVHSQMTRLHTLQLLLELFFKFSLNNFLHTQVTQCITCILSQPVLSAIQEEKSLEMDGLNNNPQKKLENGEESLDVEVLPSKDEENLHQEEQHLQEAPKDAVMKNPLLVQLFSECNIIQKLLECYANENSVSKEKMRHNMIGYMGHLREIANSIVESAKEGPCAELIQNEIKKIPNDVITEWEEFTLIGLAEINLKNKIIPLQDALVELMPGILHRDSEDDSEEEFYSVESLVIVNKGFKEGDMESISDLRFVEGNFSVGNDLHEYDGRMDKFEEICAARSSDLVKSFDFWKDKEKNITFGSLQKSDEEENPHSSSEEEVEIDEEFDTLRSADEKMEVDFFSDVAQPPFVTEWPEVLDRRKTIVNVGAELNPWQSAPASDTAEHNSWADFGASPYIDSGNAFNYGDSQIQSRANLASFPTSSMPCPISQIPSDFQADFSNLDFSIPKNEDGVCFPMEAQNPSSQLPSGILSGASTQSQSTPASFQDGCDATKSCENMQQNFVSQDVLPLDESMENVSKEDDDTSDPSPGPTHQSERDESFSGPGLGCELELTRVDSSPSSVVEGTSPKIEPSSFARADGCSPHPHSMVTFPLSSPTGQDDPSAWEGDHYLPSMPPSQEFPNPSVESGSPKLEIEKDLQSQLSSGISSNSPL